MKNNDNAAGRENKNPALRTNPANMADSRKKASTVHSPVIQMHTDSLISTWPLTVENDEKQ